MVGKVCFVDEKDDIDDDFMDGKITDEVLPQIKDTYEKLQQLETRIDKTEYLSAWFQVLTTADKYLSAKIVLI